MPGQPLPAIFVSHGAPDHAVLKPAAKARKIAYPKADGSLSRREKACVENCVDRLADAK